MAKLRRITGLEELQVELQGIFVRLSSLISQHYNLAIHTEEPVAGVDDGLGSCIGHLRSVGNVMLLVRLPEAQVFCGTLEDVCHRLIARKHSDASLSEALGFGVIVLQRYIDFVTREQLSVPPLLIPFVNEVRKALGQKSIEEGFFTRLSLQELAKRNKLPPHEPEGVLLVRSRHAYQRGLIFVLKGDTRNDGLLVMKKVVSRLIEVYHGTPIGIFWDALSVVLKGLSQGWLRLTDHRKGVLSAVDRVLYQLTAGNFTSQSLLHLKGILRDLLFLSALCRDYLSEANILAEAFGVDDVHFDDAFLEHQRRALLGPDADTYTTFFDRFIDLITEIRQLTTQQIEEPSIGNTLRLHAMFASASSLFMVLDVNELCTEIESINVSLEQDEWGNDIAHRVVELLVRLEHEIGYRQLLLKPNDYINRARPDLIHSKNVSVFFLVSAQKALVEEVLFELQKIISSVERVEHIRGLIGVNWPDIVQELNKAASVLALINLTDFSQGMSRLAQSLASLIDVQLVYDRAVMQHWAIGLAALEYYCIGLLSPKGSSQEVLSMINPALKSMWVYIAQKKGSKGSHTSRRAAPAAINHDRVAEIS